MADVGRARAFRKQPTWAQKLVWRWLRDRRFSAYKFRREHPIGNYVLDFYCEEASLSIELDGSGHGHPDQQRRDRVRSKYLESQGIKELRFWNSQLRQNREGVRSMIFDNLQERAPHPLPSYTRACVVPEKKSV